MIGGTARALSPRKDDESDDEEEPRRRRRRNHGLSRKELEFGVQLYWKRTHLGVNEWPSELLDFSQWPSEDEAPALDAMDFFQVHVDYYYEFRTAIGSSFV